MPKRRVRLSIIFVSALPWCTATAQQDVMRVSLEKQPEGARLARNGAPYFVKGVGLDKGSIALAAELGANSVRTWGADHLDATLDEAHRHGMTVCAGIWLGHERHGFRYDDPAQVARQKEEARKVVERFKNHPALLVWGIGNEMEGDGKNPRVWHAVQEIARMVKELDPNHPTMTVISEFGDDPTKIQALNMICTDIDIVGLNSYGSIETLAARYRRLGGIKPYLVTEFGPRGWWESPKKWDMPLEPTSTEKAEMYRRAYETSVLGQPLCLGSYAFLWGWKQEATATWFGLLLPGGERVGAVDVLIAAWTGRPPVNRCPEIRSLAPAGGVQARPGGSVTLTLDAFDPDGDALEVAWQLVAEGAARGGGDAEPTPPGIPGAVRESDATRAVIRLPDSAGRFRAFVTVRDGRGGAATANVPISVSANP